MIPIFMAVNSFQFTFILIDNYFYIVIIRINSSRISD